MMRCMALVGSIKRTPPQLTSFQFLQYPTLPFCFHIVFVFGGFFTGRGFSHGPGFWDYWWWVRWQAKGDGSCWISKDLRSAWAVEAVEALLSSAHLEGQKLVKGRRTAQLQLEIASTFSLPPRHDMLCTFAWHRKYHAFCACSNI